MLSGFRSKQLVLGGAVETLRDLPPHAHHVHRVETVGGLLELLAERTAAHELHRDVGKTVLLAEGVDLHDVGIVEASRGLRLALEAPHEVGILAVPLQHDLQRDLTVEHRVRRKVDVAHAAVPERLLDVVRAEIGGSGQNLSSIFRTHG